MDTVTDANVSLSLAIVLAVLVAVYAIMVVRRVRRSAKLRGGNADPEFIALVNDRHAFCDSDEEYQALLGREADDPPPPIADGADESREGNGQ